MGMGIGDWRLGNGDWGLGPNPNHKTPITKTKIPNTNKFTSLIK